MIHNDDSLDILTNLFGYTKKQLCRWTQTSYLDESIDLEVDIVLDKTWGTFLKKRSENVRYQELWATSEKKDAQVHISKILKRIIINHIRNHSKKYYKEHAKKKRVSLSNLELKESEETVGLEKPSSGKIRTYFRKIGLRQSEIEFLMSHVSGSMSGLAFQELVERWNEKLPDKESIQMPSYKRKLQRIRKKLSTKGGGSCDLDFFT